MGRKHPTFAPRPELLIDHPVGMLERLRIFAFSWDLLVTAAAGITVNPKSINATTIANVVCLNPRMTYLPEFKWRPAWAEI
jgi:hypothetical protein